MYYDDHAVSCPASLYSAGIQRGRAEMRTLILGKLMDEWRKHVGSASSDDLWAFMAEVRALS